MMRLATPWALALLPLLGVLLWRSWRRGRQRQASLAYSDVDLVGGAVRPAWENHLPLALIALALLLLTLALARPQAGRSVKNEAAQGLDIMLCLDTSPSMQASDLEPTRMDAAREVSMRFVAGRPDDRIGVVVFSGIAFTQCPLTVDHRALLSLLEQVRVGITRTDGTALGTGLVTAVNRLKDVPGSGRLVVLLTDGRSNVGEIDPLTAAKLAARFGIKVYTIGVGTTERQLLSQFDEFGLPQPVQADVELDEPTLREIASVTGGRYFRATDAASLAGIYQEIDRLEKRAAPKQVAVEYQELYRWLLGPGLALLALGLVLEHTLFMEVP